jgi:hypothetical protein
MMDVVLLVGRLLAVDINIIDGRIEGRTRRVHQDCAGLDVVSGFR